MTLKHYFTKPTDKNGKNLSTSINKYFGSFKALELVLGRSVEERR